MQGRPTELHAQYLCCLIAFITRRWEGRTHPLEPLKVLQLRLELVQVGVRIAAQHRAVEWIPEYLR